MKEEIKMKLIVPASTATDLKKCLDIRKEVFVVEKNVPENLEIDDKDVVGGACIHFLIYEDAVTVGTFRVSINQNMVAKLQRLCILKEYRGKGYGSYALEFLEGFCNGQEVKKIVFDAKCSTVEFYSKRGYTTFSEEFEEVGVKHVKMMKKL